MKKLSLIITAVVLMCAGVSCDKSKEESTSSEEEFVIKQERVTMAYDDTVDKSKFVGKWQCSKLVANGNEVDDIRGIPAYALFQYDIQPDGTVNLPDFLIEISEPNDNIDYEWGTVSETEIEITGSNGSAIVYTLNSDGGLENIDSNGEEIYLEKVNDFTYFDFKSFQENMLATQPSANLVLTPVETDSAGNVVSTGEPIPAE